MIPLLFFGQTVTPLVRLIYNHLSYPAHFQVLFNICPAKVRGARRANFDSAALPLHLSRGHSPYGKTETGTRKNASTLPGPCFRFSARLIAVTKALTSLYTTDNKFPLILTDPHGFLSR